MGGRGSSSGSSNTAENKLQKEYETIDKVIKSFLKKKFPKGETSIFLRNEDFVKAGIKSDKMYDINIGKITMPEMVKYIRDNYIRKNKVSLSDGVVISIQYENGKIWNSNEYKHAPLFAKISSIIVSEGDSKLFSGNVKIYNSHKSSKNKGREPHDLVIEHIPLKDKK